MPEHTIPEELIQNIKSGKVALVVGAGLGIPSWKQLIGGMNEELRNRGEAGDKAAAKDINKLLSKSSFVRAASFLARSLGREACDRHVEKLWATPDPLPEVAAVIGQLPFRQVWTTFPGDILERAMDANLPEGWASPRVLTYQRAADINRQRTLLKLFGDFDSFAVTPTSIRQTVTRSEALLDHVRSYYRDGSLILIGFRYGDPDLAALLDRVFGSFEPPAGGSQQHYMIASGVGPVTVDELRAEHHIELINLAGRGADEKATAALIRLLEELGQRCRDEGISLVSSRPDADDLEGWLEILGQNLSDADALDAVAAIEARAESNEDWDALIDVLMARVEIEGTGPGRAALLRTVAQVFEEKIGDLPRAFTALTAALGEDPSDPSSVDEAERLAVETDGWNELVTDVSEIAGRIEDKEVAAGYWVRLGRWYHQKLDHLEYAMASYRQALKLDGNRADVQAGLAQVYRVSQRWTELADALATQFDFETDDGIRVEIAVELGGIRENNLSAISKAIGAYEKAVEIEPDCESALVALERLYRREQLWGKLAANLEARAELFERQGESGRASSARHELATLRAEKLGDLEGAIAKYEATIDSSPNDVETLRSLGGLYEKTGRTPDYLRTLERLADAVPDSERATVLRRLGAELEERPDETERTLEAYRRVLAIDPSADDAHRAVIRMNAAAENWSGLADAVTAHIDYLGDEELRAEAHARLGSIYEERENDPHRAIEAHQNAIAQVEDHEPSLAALARLYERTESWQRAVDVLERHATLVSVEPPAAAKLWTQAGKLASAELGDSDLAERYFEKALEVEGGNSSALINLAQLHKQRGNWASAIGRMTEAARASSNRLERVELLGEAAELAAIRLEEPEQAANLCLKVLELDPENRDAGLRAANFLLREQRDEDALVIVEMLARTSDSSDRREVARWEAELGALSQRLGHQEKAAKHLRRAVAADSANLVAALGLAEVLFDSAENGGLNGGPKSAGSTKTSKNTEAETKVWKEVDAVHRELLARHRATLADGQVVTGWVRIGIAADKRGDLAGARDAFARALEREPTNLEALGSVVAIETKAGRWDRVAEAKRSMLEAVGSDRKIDLLEEIGDLYAEEGSDQQRALGAYLEAVDLAPSSHKLLHKTLDIYTTLKDWRNAVETLNRIAATATAAERRAAYFYGAGVIARDEIGDTDIAAEHFAKAVDEMPEHPKAFAALDAALENKGDYKNLARAYRKRLKQSVDAPDEGLRLWTRLGEICGEHLDDVESAIAAFEVAVSLDPDNLERHEQLANMYLEAGDQHREAAIGELQILLEADPSRVELFKALFELYRAQGQTDKAFCLAQALVFLGAAGDDESGLFTQCRPRTFAPAKRRLTEELWQKAILHSSESRHVNAIFSQIVGQLSATTAQPPSAFNLDDSAIAGEVLAARLTRYAAEILALDPEPQVYIRREVDGFRVANTALSGRLSPSVLIGDDTLAAEDERSLAFKVGKRLAYLRPDRYVNYSLGSLPKVESAFHAALSAAGVSQARGEDVAQLAGHLRASVPHVVLEQIAQVAEKMPGDPSNGLISGWRVATELTSNRVGLILCNDLEVAAHSMATEVGGFSPLPAKDQIRDLLAYSVSEDYFAVRRHLGLTVGD